MPVSKCSTLEPCPQSEKALVSVAHNFLALVLAQMQALLGISLFHQKKKKKGSSCHLYLKEILPKSVLNNFQLSIIAERHICIQFMELWFFSYVYKKNIISIQDFNANE
jgi:hypothetical protein